MKNILLLKFLMYTTLTFGQNIQIKPDSVEISDNNIPLRKSPDNNSEIISRIPSKTKVAFIDIEGQFFKVRTTENEGYIYHMFVKKNTDFLKKIGDELKIAAEELRIAERDKKFEREDSIYKENFRLQQVMNNEKFTYHLSEMTKKYGTDIGKKIAFGYIWIGMTEEMLLESWGHPIDINRTVLSGLERKQYVYKNGKYVYVENKKVTAFQD
jgi:hypothetical protein